MSISSFFISLIGTKVYESIHNDESSKTQLPLVELFKCAESSQARFFSLFLHLFLLLFLKNLWFVDFVVVVVYIVDILY